MAEGFLRFLVRVLGRGMVVAVLLAVAGRGGVAQRVRSVDGLDQNRFVGAWHEIARYPYKREKACVGSTVLLVAVGDKANQMQFVNSCADKKGYQDVRRSIAKGPKPAKGPGKTVATGEFKVATVFPFSTKVWVLAMAADDSWAVVGSPDHKHLWIFAKAPVMEAAVLGQAEAVAAGQGYDVAKLAMTPVAK